MPLVLELAQHAFQLDPVRAFQPEGPGDLALSGGLRVVGRNERLRYPRPT